MRSELNRAIAMMFQAGMKRNASDAELLARDIVCVAAELAGETGDPYFFIADGARELERRLGGDLKKSLPGYMACLRAGASRQSA
jgi:hypothetical protein